MSCFMANAKQLDGGVAVDGGEAEQQEEQHWRLSGADALQKETDILCRMRMSWRHAWC